MARQKRNPCRDLLSFFRPDRQHQSRRLRPSKLALEMLESRQLLSSTPLISEFMANNTKTRTDYYGKYTDWLEIYNPDTAAVDLTGWQLQNNSTTWSFPSNVTLASHAYLVIYCDDKDIIAPNGELHTNFKLGASGDYLALLKPDNTVVSDFSPQYPPQVADVSYGVSTSLVGMNSNVSALVPTTSNGGSALGTTWQGASANEPFDDNDWLSGTIGAGYGATTPAGSGNLRLRLNADSAAAITADTNTTGATHTVKNVGSAVTWTDASTDSSASPMLRRGVMQFTASANSQMTVNASSDLNSTTSGTISFWMNSTGTVAGTDDGAMLINMRSSRGLLVTQTNDGRIRVRCYSNSPNNGTLVNDFITTTSVSDGQWHHIVLNYDIRSGNACAVYIDGTINKQNNNSAAWSWTTGNPLEIGRSTASGQNPSLSFKNYNGLLDDFRFYNAQLTTQQISDVVIGLDGGITVADVGLNLQSQMQNVNTAAFIRIPFNVTLPDAISSLKLTMRYNDGFVAWINGQKVASANAPVTPVWNSAATAVHSTERYDVFTITVTPGMLVAGTNILAIEGLNNSSADGNFFISPLLDTTAITAGSGMYFASPTPGAVNSAGKANLGPFVSDVTHKVAQPTGGASSVPLTINATVDPSLRAVSSVQLAYRVMFGNETLTAMYDDGTHGDTTAGDHIYAAQIPTTSLTAGQLLRWRVIATDTLSNQTTDPAYISTTDSDQYYGTVAASSISTLLPMFQIFVPNYVTPTTTDNQTTVDTDAGARAAIFYNGELYDNVFMRIKGTTSRYLLKRSHHINFNSDHDFQWEEGEERVSKIALNSEYVDPSYVRQDLAKWLYNESGTAATPDFPVRLQMNGAFWQLAFCNIPLGSSLLEVLGYDPDGALYKDVGTLYPGWPQKATRTWEDNSDYNAFATAINSSQPTASRAMAIYDMVDLPEVVNYIAMARLTMECDDVWANMAIYRDSDGDGLWRIIPNDNNLSFGQMYYGEGAGNSGVHSSDDYLKAHPLYGGSQYLTNYRDSYNQLYDAIISNPTTCDMLLRRMRTLMDVFLQPPGTPYANRTIENQIDDLTARITPEANLDKAKWGWPPMGGPYGMGTPTFAQAISDIKTLYLDPRRTHLYVDHSLNINYPAYAGIPAQQQNGLTITFGGYEVCPLSGNQNEEYLTLVNSNSVAVDISGWKLSGGIDFTFAGGTVIPAGGTLYVSPDVVAFKQRTTGPTGGQSLFVVGGYEGRLSLTGESIQLIDQKHQVVSVLTTPSNPSIAQQYLRVTEVMYHPADPPKGSSYVNDDFEFIELKNTSDSQMLDLTGVRFTSGIEFDFTGSSVASLAPGAKALVVSNLAAFQSRYGTSYNSIIAGQYGVFSATNLAPKHLSNGGEKIALVDALGETILSFSNDDSWYTQSDGAGNSLVIRDARAADLSLWDQHEGWFASHAANGSPGADETPDYTAGAIVVNELLSHRTDEPNALGDWVEFYNATAAAINIGGWYLSNDNADLKKFQIAAGTTIPGYGYKAFNWRDNFGSTANAGCITPFTLGEMGGTVYLTSASGGVLTTFQTSESFGSSDTGVTLGRYIKSTGGKDFVPMTTPTYEAANSAPLVGPVVINEINYHPGEGMNAFIELKNITAQEVKLYDTLHPQNTWHLSDGVDFEFPLGAAIPANGYALIVTADPTYFRTKYNIPASVPIYGPYAHNLDKGGDTIELKYPDDPQPDGEVPYDRMDQITYGDSGLWPVVADGGDASLNRILATAYGNDAANWTAGYPTPGAGFAAFVANPITIVNPAAASPSTVTGNTTNLSVSASDIQSEANILYDWSVTAIPHGAAYPTFSSNDSNAAKSTTVTFYKAGLYTFTVTMADVYGGRTTSSVNVTVAQTLTGLGLQPSSLSILPGGTQQFSVVNTDQFGSAIGAVVSPITWSTTAGTINSTGFFTAPTSGSATVTAVCGTTTLNATVQVVTPAVSWKLDGNGNDSSGNNRTLTLVNNPPYVAGKVGSSLSFDGSNYANSTGSLVNTSQPFSVAAWVNWNGDGGWNTMISEDGTNNSTFFFQKRSGGSFAIVGDNGTGTEGVAMWPTTPNANTWYYLVGVYTGSQLKMYVNGALVAASPFNQVGVPTGDVIVGAAKYGGGRVDYFHGMIDEVRLFNGALSDGNVAAFYNNGLAMPSGWTDTDIGSPNLAGNATSTDGASWTLTGGGLGIGGNADQANYAWKIISGGASIIAQVNSLTNTDPAAKAGIMMRTLLDSGSPSAGIYVTPSGQTQLDGRETSGGTSITASVGGDPRWLKLERRDSSIYSYYSADGAVWTQLGTAIDVGRGPVYVGLAVSSHQASQICTATFANVQFDFQPTDLTLSVSAIPENRPVGTKVGSLTTSDPDSGNTFTYSLASGVGSGDNASFTIDSSGNLLTAAAFDNEAKSSYAIRIRTTDQGGLWYEEQFTINVVDVSETLSVAPSDLPLAGTAELTLAIGPDGKLHVYRTGTSTDIVPAHILTKVVNVVISGRDNLDEILTVDFANGNPVPAGGASFNGGLGGGNTLVIGGGSSSDSVTFTASQISNNYSAPISYSNVLNFNFELSGGINNLLIDHATLSLYQDNAISAGTKVTVNNGILDFQGHDDPIGNLTLTDNGQAYLKDIHNTTTTVASGTLVAESIVCDALVIGMPAAAAGTASPSNMAAVQPKVETAAVRMPFFSISAAVVDSNAAAVSPVETIHASTEPVIIPEAVTVVEPLNGDATNLLISMIVPHIGDSAGKSTRPSVLVSSLCPLPATKSVAKSEVASAAAIPLVEAEHSAVRKESQKTFFYSEAWSQLVHQLALHSASVNRRTSHHSNLHEAAFDGFDLEKWTAMLE